LHCLFTFGFEYRGSASAGILSMGYAASPFHASILIEDASKFAEKVTVYTNGDPVLAEAIKEKVPSNKTVFDSRVIIGLTNGSGESSGITIVFEDGESQTEDFIVHQPPTRINPEIVEQLGLELDARGDIVTKGPFYQTTVPGVFAAGDYASPFKIIPNAMLMGANAGAEIARELPRRLTGNPVDRFKD
jgi:gliotoxin/aspirochlorine biosynthesis thioredoxin reductase